jgi:hypothetical protein
MLIFNIFVNFNAPFLPESKFGFIKFRRTFVSFNQHKQIELNNENIR